MLAGIEKDYTEIYRNNIKEELSSFLPGIPGNIAYIDLPGAHNNTSLSSLLQKPLIRQEEIRPLDNAALAGFRLCPGRMAESYQQLCKSTRKGK